MAMSGIVLIGLVVCGRGLLVAATAVAVYFTVQERDKR